MMSQGLFRFELEVSGDPNAGAHLDDGGVFVLVELDIARSIDSLDHEVALGDGSCGEIIPVADNAMLRTPPVDRVGTPNRLAIVANIRTGKNGWIPSDGIDLDPGALFRLEVLSAKYERLRSMGGQFTFSGDWNLRKGGI